MPVFPQGLARRFGAISGLNRQSGIRNVSGRNNARYAIKLSYAFLSFLLELSYFRGRDGQRERWKAVQKARRKGRSLRAIERELGIHRSTVRSYLEAGGPPGWKQRMVPNPSISDTMAA